jgi:hypothetical protein
VNRHGQGIGDEGAVECSGQAGMKRDGRLMHGFHLDEKESNESYKVAFLIKYAPDGI